MINNTNSPTISSFSICAAFFCYIKQKTSTIGHKQNWIYFLWFTAVAHTYPPTLNMNAKRLTTGVKLSTLTWMKMINWKKTASFRFDYFKEYSSLFNILIRFYYFLNYQDLVFGRFFPHNLQKAHILSCSYILLIATCY